MMATTTTATTIRLSPDEEELLTLLADKTGRSKEAIIRDIIEEGLEDLDDALVAQEALERHRASGEPTIPYAVVRRELGLDS